MCTYHPRRWSNDQGKGVSEAIAEEKIVDMYIKGRYNVESW